MCVALIALAAVSCSDWRAERAFRRAVAAEQRLSSAELRAELKRVVERWPESRAATLAREEIEWLDDLDESSQRGRGLLAWDAVRRVGRAVDRFRTAQGRYPQEFEELVPRFLGGPVKDPWGHRVDYLRTPGGYQAICYGSDGIPGGAGDATDILVENGREIRSLAR